MFQNKCFQNTRHKNTRYQNLCRAPLWRRLLAIVYDACIICALLIVVTMIYHSVVNVWWLGRNTASIGYNPLLASLLFITVFLFLSICWRRTGQTLGMFAWRIRVQNNDGSLITWTQCVLRFMIAILSFGMAGFGFWWIFFSAQKTTWHDLYSESEVVVLPKKMQSTAHP